MMALLRAPNTFAYLYCTYAVVLDLVYAVFPALVIVDTNLLKSSSELI